MNNTFIIINDKCDLKKIQHSTHISPILCLQKEPKVALLERVWEPVEEDFAGADQVGGGGDDDKEDEEHARLEDAHKEVDDVPARFNVNS